MRHLRRPSMAFLTTEDTQLCGKLCVVYRNYGAKPLLRSRMQSTGAKVAERVHFDLDTCQYRSSFFLFYCYIVDDDDFKMWGSI